MPSPFPGMDPYIENPDLWGDFHGNLIPALRNALNAVLPRQYIATTDRHAWVERVGSEDVAHLGTPDVQVSKQPGRPNGAVAVAAPVSTSSTLSPHIIQLPLARKQGSPYLRIVDRTYRRVVSVVELLSPANKTVGNDGEAYRSKRAQYLASRVNLVEIDLLRSGQRPSLGEPPPAPSDYYIMVSRATEFPEAGLWPLSVRDRLPLVAVPLEPQVPDVVVDLRACMDFVYDSGRYEMQLNYADDPSPPLNEPDAGWARGLLAGRSQP
jgi:hypothetical protein